MRFCGGSGQRCGECGNLSEMGFVEGGAIVNKTESLFLLGVGAQKAGTTWLFDYLASSGEVATSNIKEYHIWDALLNIPSSRKRLITKEQSERDFGLKIRFFLQQSPENYFNYFAYLLAKQSKQVTCDITPAYAGLNRATLLSIRRGFERRSINTKTIFLMRDPVERCWSSARMKSTNYTGKADVSDDQVLAHARSAETEVRTRYDKTIEELEAVFEASKIYVGIYEEMFDFPQLSRLSDFCGVLVRPELVEKKLNQSPKARPLRDDTIRMIALEYRPVYEFVAARFPQAVNLWKGYAYL